jgi:hypothetical protein
MHPHVNKLLDFEVAEGLAKPYLGRRPFKSFQPATLDRFCTNFFDHPNRRGVLSEYYRQILQISPLPLTSFVRYEAHLNLTATKPSDEDILLDYGFEPDDFEELYPDVYLRNFTFSFDLRQSEYQRHRGVTEFSARCKDAQRYIQSRDTIDGFLEAEVIPSVNFFSPPISGQTLTKAISAPFPPENYKTMHLAEVADEPLRLPLGTRKKSDIHIKFLGKLSASPNSSEWISNRNDFARFLEDSAFYRITSVSGNTIYTAQFVQGEVAQKMFGLLRQFIEDTGLADAIVIEPCISFWRKTTLIGNTLRYAKVSPIVVLV